jgi:putative transposase
MPRTKRLFSDFGFYHVVNRGNERKQVFYSLADYRAFLSWVKEFKGIFDIHVIAYCLMPNHFHLLLSPKVGQNLSKFMHRLMTKQIPNFRKLHNSIGHIWQGRYKPFPVQKDSHLITAMRYIERNPVRANLVENARDWHWSSHRERLGLVYCQILHSNFMLTGKNW